MLWAIIDLYIWNRGEFVEEGPGAWETMAFKGKPVKEYEKDNKTLRETMSVAAFLLVENLSSVWGGSVGKKQVVLRKFFEYENKKYQKVHNGAEILKSREHVLRILFTTLDYLGFTICEKPQFPP